MVYAEDLKSSALVVMRVRLPPLALTDVNLSLVIKMETMETIETTIKNKPLTATQRNYVLKRINEIKETKLQNVKRDDSDFYDYRGELRGVPDYKDEATIKAIMGGYYQITKDPNFGNHIISRHKTIEDLLKCIVIPDREIIERINNQLKDEYIKRRDQYVSRIKAIKDGANNITDSLLLSDSQDVLTLLKQFESTEF